MRLISSILASIFVPSSVAHAFSSPPSAAGESWRAAVSRSSAHALSSSSAGGRGGSAASDFGGSGGALGAPKVLSKPYLFKNWDVHGTSLKKVEKKNWGIRKNLESLSRV